MEDDILDDLFHGCAVAAYIDQATLEKGPPEREATRKRAYAYYERELAARNGRADTIIARRAGRARIPELARSGREEEHDSRATEDGGGRPSDQDQ